MQVLLNANLDKSLQLWEKIKNRKYILDYATEVVTFKDKKQDIFYAPSICYMILSHPEDVDPIFYRDLVITILKNNNLNRLIVANNEMFLDLIKPYVEKNLDNFFVKMMNYEFKYNQKEELIRCVEYSNICNDNEKKMFFNDGQLDVAVGQQEIETFTSLNHINIVSLKEHNNVSLSNNDNVIVYNKDVVAWKRERKSIFERNTAARLIRKK